MNTTSLQTAADLETLRYRPKEQGGRPTLMTAEVVEAIVRMIRMEGCSDSAAGLLEGISTSTLSRWKQEDEHFAMLLGQARAQFDVARLRNIGNALNRDGSMNWRAQAWLLQHSSPETYGSPSRRRQAAAEAAQAEASSAASGLPAPFQVTPEKLAELQARRARALEKMQAADAENAKAQAAARPAGASEEKQSEDNASAEVCSTVVQGVFTPTATPGASPSAATPDVFPSASTHGASSTSDLRPHSDTPAEQNGFLTFPQHP